jgi:ribosomal protein S18 acetylase RimI-like enzyme
MGTLQWKQSRAEDFERVKQFYFQVIDGLEGKAYNPAWKKDVFPDDAMLKELTSHGELFYGEEDGKILCAFAMNHEVSPGYEKAQWKVSGPQDKIAVIHLLGVLPNTFGKGLGNACVKEAVQEAVRQGQKAIHLDVIAGNLAAVRLYERHGFERRLETTIYYEDTGWADFYLYEKVL